MADIWYSVTPKDKVEITRRLNAIEPAYHFNPDETSIDTVPLNFYGEARLLRVFKNQPGTAPFWYVQLPEEIVPLDFSIANIHHMNATAPLVLHNDTIENYLRFRLYFGDRRVMRNCRADLQDTEWKATVQFAAVDGLYEATLMISPRGEVTEAQMEKRHDNGYVTLPEFTSAS
jgi:hypothetical protein